MSEISSFLSNSFQASGVIFQIAVGDVPEEKATTRCFENTNAFNRTAGHVVASRVGLMGMLGMDAVELGWGAFGEFSMTAAFEEENACPTLAEINEGFTKISKVFHAGLPGVASEIWEAKPPFEPPIDDQSIRGLAIFMAFHEAYHVGQLSLISKSISGNGAMRV